MPVAVKGNKRKHTFGDLDLGPRNTTPKCPGLNPYGHGGCAGFQNLRVAADHITHMHGFVEDKTIHCHRRYAALGTMQRLAYELAVNTGARVSDLYRLGKMHEKEGGLTWKPFKGQDISNEISDDNALEASIPITPQLRTAIDAVLSGHLIYVAT